MTWGMVMFLTGRYNWRFTLQDGIVPPYGDLLIKGGQLTVPGLQQQNGYHTDCIGKDVEVDIWKWHTMSEADASLLDDY
jgi:arylsulfatase A-like enzyme